MRQEVTLGCRVYTSRHHSFIGIHVAAIVSGVHPIVFGSWKAIGGDFGEFGVKACQCLEARGLASVITMIDTKFSQKSERSAPERHPGSLVILR